MIKVAIVGAAGYSGLELIRILALHPQVDIQIISSRSHKGKHIAKVFPHLAKLDLEFTDASEQELAKCDLVFFATPNLIAMQYAPYLVEQGVKVIDLSADFRIKDLDIWQQHYQAEHACSHLVENAVYGLSEVNSQQIAAAQLVANPGCYPTAVQLGLWPLLANNLIKLDNLIADVKSGTSGAGKSLNEGNLYCSVNESLHAYKIGSHRHAPEIMQGLSNIAGTQTSLLFVPHLIPMNRGIHATIYCNLKDQQADITKLYQEFYNSHPFVQIVDEGAQVTTAAVKGSNNCLIGITQLDKQLVICSAIDNLIKGAAGQAVQNMNIMYNLPQTTGLEHIALIN